MGRTSEKRRQRRQATPAARSVATPPATPEPSLFTPVTLALLAALVVLTVVVFLPVRHYGFIALDDPQYVSENPHIVGGLTWNNLVWAFTARYASYWIPLIWVSHMIDIQLYGLNAGGHHITNLLLHVVNTLLLFALLYRTTRALGRSAFVAALFAIHPLHVESVVWVTERKDVLSTLFWMLTMWAYVSYVRRPGWWRYAWVCLWLVLGLMAKPMLVTLPFALLLLDVWPLGRLSFEKPLPKLRADVWPLLREKAPLAVIAIGFALVTLISTQQTGAVAGLDLVPLNVRLENIAVSYAAYIAKMFWPANLALFYPYPKSIAAWLWVSSLVTVLAVSIAAVLSLRRWPYFPVGWFWYLGTLVPVIGFIQAGTQRMADRFVYVPLIGVFVIVAWGGAELAARLPYRRFVLASIAIVIVTAASVAARTQVNCWRTPIVLWERALAITTENDIAHINLGIALQEQGNVKDAIPHYREAIRIRPNFAEAHNDLAVALANEGQRDEAIAELLEALRLKPDQAQSHYNVGVLLSQKGNAADAEAHFEAALRIDPAYEDARRELQRLKSRRPTG